MVKITPESKILTLINVFTVEDAEKQQALLDALIAADEEIKRMPGCISASFHRSLGGKRVVNYTQWTNMEAIRAMQSSPQVATHLEQVRQMVTSFTPIYCEVVYSAEAASI